MYKFVKHILLFFLLIVIPLDVIVTFSLYNTFILVPSWTQVKCDKADADVLIMGHSRAEVQYSPYILDSVLGCNSYNLGFSAARFNTQILRYNYYRRFHTAPKAIIQNIDYSTLGYKCPTTEHVTFLPMVYDNTLRNELYECGELSFAEAYIPLYRYMSQDNDLYGAIRQRVKNGVAKRDKGYLGVPWGYDGTALAGVDTFQFENDARTRHIFEDFLQSCKEEDIKMVFVFAPLYIDAINKVYDSASVRQVFSYYAEKYDAVLLDYTYSYLSYDNAYFYNGTHLNKDGAERFSRMLAHDLDSLGVFSF